MKLSVYYVTPNAALSRNTLPRSWMFSLSKPLSLPSLFHITLLQDSFCPFTSSRRWQMTYLNIVMGPKWRYLQLLVTKFRGLQSHPTSCTLSAFQPFLMSSRLPSLDLIPPDLSLSFHQQPTSVFLINMSPTSLGSEGLHNAPDTQLRAFRINFGPTLSVQRVSTCGVQQTFLSSSRNCGRFHLNENRPTRRITSTSTWWSMLISKLNRSLLHKMCELR
jgi:hypothetical protein